MLFHLFRYHFPHHANHLGRFSSLTLSAGFGFIGISHHNFGQLSLQIGLQLLTDQGTRVLVLEEPHVIELSQHTVLYVYHPQILTGNLLHALSGNE